MPDMVVLLFLNAVLTKFNRADLKWSEKLFIVDPEVDDPLGLQLRFRISGGPSAVASIIGTRLRKLRTAF